MAQIVLGARYRDKITGFIGTATGHCEYLSGCHQTLIVPQVTPDGTFKSGEWFDDQRLERMSGDVVALENDKTPGFDKPAPKR